MGHTVRSRERGGFLVATGEYGILLEALRPESKRRRASLLFTAEDHTGLPPALIVSAEFDPLCDDGRNYANKLQAAGVPVKFRFYDGMIHGFLWMSGVLDQSKALVDEIGREVRAVLG